MKQSDFRVYAQTNSLRRGKYGYGFEVIKQRTPLWWCLTARPVMIGALILTVLHFWPHGIELPPL